MKNGIVGKMKTFCIRLRKELTRFLFKPAKTNIEKSQLGAEEFFESPESMAYNTIGDRTAWIMPLFKDLDVRLRKSGLKVTLKAYVSLTIFTTGLICIAALTLVPLLLFLFLGVPLLPALLFGVGGSLFSLAFSILGFYIYPIYRADKNRRELEDELPFMTGYMAILASAGVSPERIFYSLSHLNVQLAVTAESKNIVRDVNLFGSDIISALEETSERTPSERFHDTIEGVITTVHSGGNLAAYLREKSREYMSLKRINLKKYSDTLSMLSEVYVTLLLTGPLFFVVMLVIMSMLGGGEFLVINPDLLLELLTYIGIPAGAIIFLIILDAIAPKR